MVESVIKFENVVKKFGSFIAVNKISLEVKKGEVIGFIGPNGAGKTTTLKLLARLMKPTSGNIYVINTQGKLQDISKSSRNLSEMGFLVDIPHFHNSSPYRILRFLASIRNYSKDKLNQRIDHLLINFDLIRWKYKKVDSFSKGMKQTLGFIAAIIHEPEIIVLDEPQTGLDPNARIKIRNHIKSLKQEGKTVFVASHMLYEIAEVCDKIVLINQGRIFGFDTIDNLEYMLKTKEIVCKILNPIPSEEIASIIDKIIQQIKPYLKIDLDPLIPSKPIRYDPQEKTLVLYYDGKEESRSNILNILVNKFKTDLQISSFSEPKTSQLEKLYTQMINNTKD